jgi:phage shock protein PspC (stress-responsive transcriptional regulator)
MDKTININLGGTLFQIDDAAFLILRDYLQAINNRFANVQGGHETIEDIELRIAEIFQSQKGLAGVITRENVDAMIAIIGKPEDFDHGEPATESPVYSSQKKKMYRNTEDTIIGGVCSGIAAYLDSDPVLFRILFVLFTLLFGAGFFVYVALWIALPAARTDSQKRAMYGNSSHMYSPQSAINDGSQITGTPHYNSGYNSTSRLGSAINEVFRAIGRVFYIIVRIFLIITGVVFVLTGFLLILSFVMVFIFKYPGAFSFDSSGVNLIYFPDFLNYIVNPAAAPWIMILASLAFILPMIALIYWGVKMIFWFRARDGVVSLAGLVIWVMAIAALAIICFNEGISFAETGKSSVETVLPDTPDTLYVKTDHKISELMYNKQISLPHEEYSVFLNDDKKELYIRPYISVDRSFDRITRIEMRKRSTGRSEIEAVRKTETLLFNYSFKNDSLKIDEYFTVPAGRKWAADEIGMHLYVPEGTVIKFDERSRVLVRSHFQNEFHDNLESRWESGTGCWIMTDDGLEPAAEKTIRHK